MGLTEKSSVTAFLDKYYEKHPLDNSYEGILARRSGLTKDKVIALLDYADKMVFLASYDPTNLLPLPSVSLQLNYQHVSVIGMNDIIMIKEFMLLISRTILYQKPNRKISYITQ